MTMPTTSNRFEYHTEPILTALLAVVVLIVAGALFRVMLFRLLLIGTAAGPLAWVLFQIVRRGRAVILTPAGLVIQYTLPRREIIIPYHQIEGYAVNSRGGLAVVYHIVSKTGPSSPSPYALSNARPDSHNRARHRFLATPAIDNIKVLSESLDAHLPSERTFEPQFMQVMLQRLRTRNIILIILAVLGTPIYVIALTRLLSSFIH